MSELGIVGLGKMGSGIARRLLAAGHRVVASDRDPAAMAAAAEDGVETATDLAGLAARLAPPRAVWMMVPAGPAVDSVTDALVAVLEAGDVVIDGGNSNFHHSRRRATRLRETGLAFLDVGTSGGLWGEREGYCLMVGGEPETVARLTPIFETLGGPEGWLHCGPAGSGHYVKMAHNGIEYAIMQSYAEGFELLEASDFELDSAAIADLWTHGSIIRSWLLELAAAGLRENPGLEDVAPRVADSGEGRWMAIEAIERGVPIPAITAALQARFRSQRPRSYAWRFLNLLRNKFGGHAVIRDRRR